MTKDKPPEEGAKSNAGSASSASSSLPAAKKLPKQLQRELEKADKEDQMWAELWGGGGCAPIHCPEPSPWSSQRRVSDAPTGRPRDSTESNVRYAAYAARVRTILLSAQRYVAYTSDIGESFRPVAHPYLVRGAYCVSWAYLAGDVLFEGYKARLRAGDTRQQLAGQPRDAGAGAGAAVPPLHDYKTVMAQRALFQSVASMGLPAFTIHSIVRYSGRAMKDVRNPRLRAFGPIGVRSLSRLIFNSSLYPLYFAFLLSYCLRMFGDVTRPLCSLASPLCHSSPSSSTILSNRLPSGFFTTPFAPLAAPRPLAKYRPHRRAKTRVRKNYDGPGKRVRTVDRFACTNKHLWRTRRGKANLVQFCKDDGFTLLSTMNRWILKCSSHGCPFINARIRSPDSQLRCMTLQSVISKRALYSQIRHLLGWIPRIVPRKRAYKSKFFRSPYTLLCKD